MWIEKILEKKVDIYNQFWLSSTTNEDFGFSDFGFPYIIKIQLYIEYYENWFTDHKILTIILKNWRYIKNTYIIK